MSRYTLSTTHPTPAAQLTPDCPVSDFSGLSVLPDTSPEPPTHSPTIPENFENFHFFHDFDPPGMVSDDSESMVPLGDHLTSPVKILTRSLIIHGHVSKLEIFHTLLKTLFPPPSCMHPDLRSTCSTCSESLLYSIISLHPAPSSGPGKRGIALGFLAVLPAREIEGVPGTLILAKVPGLTEQQRKVSSWGFGLHVVSFSGSKATFRGSHCHSKWSSIDHFVCNQAARTLLTSPRVNRQPYSVPVQHRRLYRATTKKAICRAKNAYRAWLAIKSSILSPQETIQGKYNQYILAEATASRLTKQDDRLRWRSHCTRIDNLLAGGCAKQTWNAANAWHVPRDTLVDLLIQLEMKRVFFNSSPFPYARLSSLLESNNVLVPEQGGFRTREESTAQVCALMDILRRRQIADLNSHIAFIDISKAFDTVPIHALLFKLRCIGIPTITMNFCLPIPLPMHALDLDLSCRTLFQCSVVLDKDVPSQGSYSMSFNDVLDGVAPISVPGLSQEHHPRGLMFADDIAIIAPSHESLCTSMGTIADWATRWEMSFGVAKCGVAYYYGLELIGGNLHSRSSTSSACQYRHSHDSQGPLFTPIAPMLTDCGIISLDAHAILARVRLTVKATTLKTPLRTLLTTYSPLYYSISL
ncbi:hypothetical protein BASA83_010585 [Batrachochytrium salamandrivorans]|nr:hypothetical protein BASA83_010585 [Batrachochytrium salamandrivorans]